MMPDCKLSDSRRGSPLRCIFIEQSPMTVQDFKQVAEDELKHSPVHQRKASAVDERSVHCS